MREAFAAEGIKVEWGFFPWKRAFNNAKNGSEWDASAVWGSDSEIEEEFWISDKVVISIRFLFHRKDMKFDWVIQSIQ